MDNFLNPRFFSGQPGGKTAGRIPGGSLGAGYLGDSSMPERAVSR